MKGIDLKLGVFFSFVIILTLNGLRVGVGTDYDNYKDIYYLIKNGLPVSVEPGYVVINKVFADIDKGYKIVFFFSTFITYFLIYLTIRYYQIYGLGILFMFCFGFIIFTNNIIRQGIAISIFFYGIKYITNKNLIKYIFTCLFAALFHISAVLLIPFYFLANIKLSRNRLYIILFLAIIMTFTDLLRSILLNVVGIFPKYLNYIGGAFDDTAGNFGISMILLFILISVIIYFYNNLILNQEEGTIINLFLWGTILSFPLFKISFLFRFSYYFSMLIFLALPIFLRGMENSVNKNILSILFITYALIWWLRAFIFNDHGMIPYNSLLFN
ncbi:MAG: EpsG family protein [bacterium]